MTRTTTHTTTIQCWPSGKSYTYRGDIDGPVNQRSLKDPTRPGIWRKGTPDEWKAIRINTRAEMYERRDILCCDSSLVDDLIKLEHEVASPGSSRGADLAHAFSYDQIENLYTDPSDWDAAACYAWLEEHSPRDPHDPTEDEGGDLEALRELVRDYAEAAEVYEWWRVTGWLCEQLRKTGEVVIDNAYGYWWGRTCSGQALIMDGTLQTIAAQYEQDEVPA